MMETKDIYTAAGGVTGGDMEQKSVPGYVPAPVVNPDVVAPEDTEQDSGTTGDEGGTSDGGKTASGGGSKATSKSTTAK